MFHTVNLQLFPHIHAVDNEVYLPADIASNLHM